VCSTPNTWIFWLAPSSSKTKSAVCAVAGVGVGDAAAADTTKAAALPDTAACVRWGGEGVQLNA